LAAQDETSSFEKSFQQGRARPAARPKVLVVSPLTQAQVDVLNGALAVADQYLPQFKAATEAPRSSIELEFVLSVEQQLQLVGRALPSTHWLHKEAAEMGERQEESLSDYLGFTIPELNNGHLTLRLLLDADLLDNLPRLIVEVFHQFVWARDSQLKRTALQRGLYGRSALDQAAHADLVISALERFVKDPESMKKGPGTVKALTVPVTGPIAVERRRKEQWLRKSDYIFRRAEQKEPATMIEIDPKVVAASLKPLPRDVRPVLSDWLQAPTQTSEANVWRRVADVNRVLQEKGYLLRPEIRRSGPYGAASLHLVPYRLAGKRESGREAAFGTEASFETVEGKALQTDNVLGFALQELNLIVLNHGAIERHPRDLASHADTNSASLPVFVRAHSFSSISNRFFLGSDRRFIQDHEIFHLLKVRWKTEPFEEMGSLVDGLSPSEHAMARGDLGAYLYALSKAELPLRSLSLVVDRLRNREDAAHLAAVEGTLRVFAQGPLKKPIELPERRLTIVEAWNLLRFLELNGLTETEVRRRSHQFIERRLEPVQGAVSQWGQNQAERRFDANEAFNAGAVAAGFAGLSFLAMSGTTQWGWFIAGLVPLTLFTAMAVAQWSLAARIFRWHVARQETIDPLEDSPLMAWLKKWWRPYGRKLGDYTDIPLADMERFFAATNQAYEEVAKKFTEKHKRQLSMEWLTPEQDSERRLARHRKAPAWVERVSEPERNDRLTLFTNQLLLYRLSHRPHVRDRILRSIFLGHEKYHLASIRHPDSELQTLIYHTTANLWFYLEVLSELVRHWRKRIARHRAAKDAPLQGLPDRKKLSELSPVVFPVNAKRGQLHALVGREYPSHLVAQMMLAKTKAATAPSKSRLALEIRALAIRDGAEGAETLEELLETVCTDLFHHSFTKRFREEDKQELQLQFDFWELVARFSTLVPPPAEGPGFLDRWLEKAADPIVGKRFLNGGLRILVSLALASAFSALAANILFSPHTTLQTAAPLWPFVLMGKPKAPVRRLPFLKAA
jgi:hypothetical protein